ncbi:MAG: aminotransferase class IV family protein [Anaerolineae bacterium]|jgi:branched-chain amino acid aminotransferase|nr:aminotransferase class IV family protein [Anaerolineae bacterium]
MIITRCEPGIGRSVFTREKKRVSQVSNPIPTAILTPTGLKPTSYQVATLAEAIPHEPQGVYTVARTFHGDHALLLDAHLDRLEESARLVGIPLTLDRARLRAALRELIRQAAYPDAKFRVTIPRSDPEQVYLALEAFQPVPAEVQQRGAHVITTPLKRANPVAKTTEWMTIRRPSYSSLPPGVYEGILVREDETLLEGMSSNFYGVLDGVLRTAGDGVLAGITRRAILQLTPDVLPVALIPLTRRDIPRLAEAMLTSSGRGVVPITVIDGQPVGDGKVGPVVSEIRRGYDAWTETNLEPI